MKALENIRVVLVRPELAGNVGAAARVLKNFGLKHLVLVNPGLDRPEDAATRAHGARDVVEGADTVADLFAAIAPCARAWATTRREGKHRPGVADPRQAAAEMVELAARGERVAWVFGPESRGLATDEVTRCSGRVTIPTSCAQPSLNLAQAVAICAYETYRASRPRIGAAAARVATVAEREALYRHLEEMLLAVGFLHPQTARTRMAALRGLIERARPGPREVRLLRGIARQVQWAAGPEDDPVEPDPDPEVDNE